MGKGGNKTTPLSENEVLIEGRAYDIQNLKHPGGSVIKFYAGNGVDATQAYHNFHLRSKKAKKYLDSLPSREVDSSLCTSNRLPGQDALVKDFEEFTRQLESEGLFKPSLPHAIYRIAEILVMHIIGFWLLFNGYTVPAILILGVVSGRCGWLMHEGGHNSLTGVYGLNFYFFLSIRLYFVQV